MEKLKRRRKVLLNFDNKFVTMQKWNEIKLRNPDHQTCSNVNKIMEFYNAISASKAVTNLINDFTKQQKKIQLLEKKCSELEREVRANKDKMEEDKMYRAELKQTFNSFISLINVDEKQGSK